jgi:hypothetical protein
MPQIITRVLKRERQEGNESGGEVMMGAMFRVREI